MEFPLEEIEAAFENFKAVAAEVGRTGEWARFADLFTEDVTYIEHHYGTMKGRAAVREWIVPAMTAWPASRMTSFPWAWHVIDAENGWIVGEVLNVMDDPGDGKTYQAANWSRLIYAGNGLFSEEEDVYNPAEFATMIGEWITAYKAHSNQAS